MVPCDSFIVKHLSTTCIFGPLTYCKKILKFCWYHSDTNSIATCDLHFHINLDVKKMSRRLVCLWRDLRRWRKPTDILLHLSHFFFLLNDSPCALWLHTNNADKAVCLLSHQHFVHKAWVILIYVTEIWNALSFQFKYTSWPDTTNICQYIYIRHRHGCKSRHSSFEKCKDTEVYNTLHINKDKKSEYRCSTIINAQKAS